MSKHPQISDDRPDSKFFGGRDPKTEKRHLPIQSRTHTGDGDGALGSPFREAPAHATLLDAAWALMNI